MAREIDDQTDRDEGRGSLRGQVMCSAFTFFDFLYFSDISQVSRSTRIHT